MLGSLCKLALLSTASAIHLGSTAVPRTCMARGVRSRPIRCLDDADLMASLRARMETKEAAPKGVDEVGADQMGPTDVVEYVMNAVTSGDFKTLYPAST